MKNEELALILFVASSIGNVFFIMLFIRNEWVHRNRMKLIQTPAHNRLPSYNAMMCRWWVWDINKFL